MRCKIDGCHNDAVAAGMCAMHYMRQRRTGDPTVTLKPGRKPGPKAPDPRAELARLREELARLRAENAKLKSAPPVMRMTVEEMLARQQAVKAARAKQRAANRAKRRATEDIPDEKTKQEYERRIASLQTQVRTLRAELAATRKARDGKVVTTLDHVGWKLIRDCLSPNYNDGPEFTKRRAKAFPLFCNAIPEPRF
jgi:hypothetical protein